MPAPAGKLRGTLGEVAIITKAGIPLDTDFNAPQDGMLVLDTSVPVTLWARSTTWRPIASGAIYTEATANVASAALTEDTADVVLTASSSIVCDGISAIEITFWAFSVRPDATTAARSVNFYLYEDGASIGRVGLAATAALGSDNKPTMIRRRFVPTAGTHTYSIRTAVNAGTALISAGPAGHAADDPMFLSIKRAA
jgi:hypothetical protein